MSRVPLSQIRRPSTVGHVFVQQKTRCGKGDENANPACEMEIPDVPERPGVGWRGESLRERDLHDDGPADEDADYDGRIQDLWV